MSDEWLDRVHSEEESALQWLVGKRISRAEVADDRWVAVHATDDRGAHGVVFFPRSDNVLRPRETVGSVH